MYTDDLKSIMSDLYFKYGPIDEVIRLSQVIDEIINNKMRNEKLKELEDAYIQLKDDIYK